MNRHEFYDNLNKYKANSLTHYGTLGQKWGVRKWQNADGTFNEAGKERYFGKSSKNSFEDDEKLSGLFSKKKKNEDTNTNENIKKETTVDYLNKLLEDEAKRKEKYKHVYNYIQEKNENGKYEDEYGEYDDPDFDSENEKIGGLFNPKSDFRDNPFYKEEQTILLKARFINDENIYLKKKAMSQMAGEQIKFADQDPLLSNYYNDIEVLEAMKMQDKYPGIDINTIRQNHFHEENEPFIDVRYLDDNMKNALERWGYLENKRLDYPVNSKKNNKCVGEMQKIDAEFLLKEKEIEEELANNVLEYIKNNKEKIQQNVKNIRKNVDSINNIEVKVNENGKERKYSLKDSPYVYDLWGYINRAINQLYLIHDYDKYENNSYQKGFSDLTSSDWKQIYNYVEKHFGEDAKNGMYKYWYSD